MHPACSTPVTVGWWTPKIVLPAGWTEWPEGQREAVLAHEQAHVRRRDPFFQWLALFNRAVFWFHPLSWWLERKLSALAEESCDAAVLDRGHDPGEYSSHLVNLARIATESGGRIHALGMPMPGLGLRERLGAILARTSVVKLSRARLACAAGVVAAICVAGRGGEFGSCAAAFATV